MMKHFRAHAQSLRKARGTNRHHHKLLYVDVVVGVLTAVNYVEHRHGQDAGINPAHVLEQGQAGVRRCRLCHGQGYCQHGICTEPTLIGRAVELDKQLVNARLVKCAQANQSFRNLPVDVIHRARNSLP